MFATTLAVLLTVPVQSASYIDTLPAKPGVYRFELLARDGYSWNGKTRYVTRPYRFNSQQQAWRYMQRNVDWRSVKQVGLYSYEKD